jgi:hypothetical protein
MMSAMSNRQRKITFAEMRNMLSGVPPWMYGTGISARVPSRAAGNWRVASWYQPPSQNGCLCDRPLSGHRKAIEARMQFVNKMWRVIAVAACMPPVDMRSNNTRHSGGGGRIVRHNACIQSRLRTSAACFCGVRLSWL